jgi:hypothetical protein
MAAPEDLTRDQVIAHRLAVHGLTDRVRDLTDLAVLDSGSRTPRPARRGWRLRRGWPTR